jgi:glutathione S-transferase
MELTLMLPIAQVFRHLHPSMAGLEVPQVKEWGEANRSRALDMMAILDEHLASNRFLVGDTYSIADITGLCAMDFARPARVQRPETMTNLARWHAELAARPSAKA